MKEFVESRLVFRFDDDWVVEQWDEHPGYRGPDGFEKAPGCKACDFVGWHATGSAYLFEVKNFVGFHHRNSHRLDPDGLPVEAAEKVRDTLAGLVWTRGRAADVPPLRDAITPLLDALIGTGATRIHVVLWVEDRPPLNPADASVLMNELRRQLLRWFKIRKVLVTSISVAGTTEIPGLTVRPAT